MRLPVTLWGPHTHITWWILVLPRAAVAAEILGEFQRDWAASGKERVQIFTKYVPNIFQARPTPSSVEASIRRSIKALQVSVQASWPGQGRVHGRAGKQCFHDEEGMCAFVMTNE